MRDKINELNIQKNKVANLETTILMTVTPRLELFLTAMREVQAQDPKRNVWSRIKYPHNLTDDNYSTFTINLRAVENSDRIEVSWYEEEFRGGSSDSRSNQFSVHNTLFTDEYESYIKTKVEEYQQDVDIIIEEHEQERIDKKRKKIEDLERDIAEASRRLDG